MKNLRYMLEGGLAWVFISICQILSPAAASELGGWLARAIGPNLAVNRRAIRHLQTIYPEKSLDELDRIIYDMWDNLGRTIAEYPHLAAIARDRTEVIGIENADKAMAEYGNAIFLSGHIANWELSAPTYYEHRKIALALVYRPPNNPYVAKLLDKMRGLNGILRTLPKSREGSRKIVECMKEGTPVGILIDQKYNEGIAVPFLGKLAMTSQAFAQLSQKYDCPILPARVERLPNVKFRITIYPPLKIRDEQGEDLPLKTVVAEAHAYLQNWINDKPGQWIWLHRRWSSAKLQQLAAQEAAKNT